MYEMKKWSNFLHESLTIVLETRKMYCDLSSVFALQFLRVLIVECYIVCMYRNLDLIFHPAPLRKARIMKQTVIQFSLAITLMAKGDEVNNNTKKIVQVMKHLCTFINNMWLFVCQKIGSCKKTWFDDFFSVLLHAFI